MLMINIRSSHPSSCLVDDHEKYSSNNLSAVDNYHHFQLFSSLLWSKKKYLLSKIIWIFCYDRGAVVPSVVEEVEVVVAMDIEELVGEEEVEGEEDLHSQLLDHFR